jgi:hypothetical protein
MALKQTKNSKQKMPITSIANPTNPKACSLFLMSNNAHVEKKHGTKLKNAPKSTHFQILPHVFFLC